MHYFFKDKTKIELNICIDIGNTNAKIGIFDKETLKEVIPEVTDRNIEKLSREKCPEQVIIASVRKGIGKIVNKISTVAPAIVLSHTTPIPIKSIYKTPSTLGVDRISSVVGAHHLYPNKNILVIDIGTCITYDLIDEKETYHGGGISPGVDMRLKAMHKFTSKLPVVSAKRKTELIGKTTKECMMSGAVNGTSAEIEGIILRYRQFFNDLTIIFCGGGANFFETKIKDHIFAVPNLVLVGLNQILRFNLNE